MAYTLIVEKTEARIVFIRDAHQPLLLDALWPPVGYNYLFWNKPLADEVLKTPWLYTFQGEKIVATPYAHKQNAEENARRGTLLVQLARATNRHRRTVIKEDLEGQETIYRLKAEEATRFLADPAQSPDSFPWLRESAAFEGLTIQQAANQIIFRYAQTQQVLRYTENQRRWFTRRILTAASNELATVQNELTEYERRG